MYQIAASLLSEVHLQPDISVRDCKNRVKSYKSTLINCTAAEKLYVTGSARRLILVQDTSKKLYVYAEGLKLIFKQSLGGNLLHASGSDTHLCLVMQSASVLIKCTKTFKTLCQHDFKQRILTSVYNSEDREFILTARNFVIYLREAKNFEPICVQEPATNYCTTLLQACNGFAAMLVGSEHELLQCLFKERKGICQTLKVNPERNGFYLTLPDGSDKQVLLNGIRKKHLKTIRVHPNMSRTCLPYVFYMDAEENVHCDKVLLQEDKKQKGLLLEQFRLGRQLMQVVPLFSGGGVHTITRDPACVVYALKQGNERGKRVTLWCSTFDKNDFANKS